MRGPHSGRLASRPRWGLSLLVGAVVAGKGATAFAAPVPLPAIDIESGFSLGLGAPMRSSRFALGDAGPAEVQPSFELSATLGVAFPQDWVAVDLQVGFGVGALDREAFEATARPILGAAGRLAVSLGLEVRPPWTGWVPYGRLLVGGAWMTSARTQNDPPCEPERTTRCPEGDPIDHVSYAGLSGGLGVGISYRARVITRRFADVRFELRYTVTEWQSLRFTGADDARVERLQVRDASVTLGRGPSVLHQVGVAIGFRVGFLAQG